MSQAGTPPLGLAPDGRDPRLVPEGWASILDPQEWRLGTDGLPSRRAARVLVLAAQDQVLLLRGHDTADRSHRWIFTPGGGLRAGEEPQDAAVRELAEETGLRVDGSRLEGPVARREAVFRFIQVVCRQHELFYLLRLPGPLPLRREGWTDQERDVVDSVGWWTLDELARAQDRGEAVYPTSLVRFLRRLGRGWDGDVADLTAAEDAAEDPVPPPSLEEGRRGARQHAEPRTGSCTTPPTRPRTGPYEGVGNARRASARAGQAVPARGSPAAASRRGGSVPTGHRSLGSSPSPFGALPTVGVLAVQGDVREHCLALEAAGARAVVVRRPRDLGREPGDRLDGLVLPGGESTTMGRLLVLTGMMDPLRGLVGAGLAVFGTCAGMVMLADRVRGGEEAQPLLGGMDMTVRRNAFGRQVDSYEEDLVAPALGAGQEAPLRAVFIRAPWVEDAGPDVEVLATTRAGAAREGAGQGGRIVAARQGPLLATSFHPEVGGDPRVHQAFVTMVRRRS